jgi:HSP20 family protein
MNVWRMRDPRNPLMEWEKMARNMDRTMKSFFQEESGNHSGVYPPVNFSEDEEALYVRAELPGVPAGDIDVSVEGENLILRGERKIESTEEVNYHRRERTAGTFRRIMVLPVRVAPTKVSAEMNNGVLTIVLPKAEEAKPRQISVQG